ncbi:MAG: NifB/NifX family molybdenum-iron cluster-binding protein [Deltaproteobacteria bacterium]|nr:NifB/NifX family molybdenum-iron cluster-binding protein [Deltaproteobacteria bacterium]
MEKGCHLISGLHCGRRFLEVRGRTIRREEIWDAGRERGPMEIARLLAASGVDKVICGGIQTEHKQWLIHRGIRVVDNQIGPFREIVGKVIRTHDAYRKRTAN